MCNHMAMARVPMHIFQKMLVSALLPVGCVLTREGEPVAKAIDGQDGKSWHLPLAPLTATSLEPHSPGRAWPEGRTWQGRVAHVNQLLQEAVVGCWESALFNEAAVGLLGIAATSCAAVPHSQVACVCGAVHYEGCLIDVGLRCLIALSLPERPSY